MRILKWNIRNQIELLRWWFVIHQLAWKSIASLLAVLALAALLWRWWDWINTNSMSLTLIATACTGIALAFFAWLTYRLSNTMLEYQYAAPVQLYSVSEPEAGTAWAGTTEYKGLRWRICLLNVGVGPAWIENMDIQVSPAKNRPVWTSVGRFCIFLDNNGDVVDPKKPLIVNGHGDISLTVVLYSPETKENLQRVFGVQEKFIMEMLVYQRRQMKKYKSHWLNLSSRQFTLPQEFAEISRPTGTVPLQKQPPKFHQP
jgi:hypothetical protein